MNIFKRVEVATQVVNLHNEGKPKQEIKTLLGISDNQISSILRHAREAGIHVERRNVGRPINPQRTALRHEVALRYKNGESGPSIAQSMNVTVEFVYSSLRALGVSRRRPDLKERNESIVVRYTDGESGVTIAKQLNITPKVVYDTLRRAGVSIRRRGSRPKAGK